MCSANNNTKEAQKPTGHFPVPRHLQGESVLFCLALLPVPPLRGCPCGRANTSVVWPTHRLFYGSKCRESQRSGRCEGGESPKSPPQKVAHKLSHTDNLHHSRKAERAACHHSRDKLEKLLDAPLKPDFYEAVKGSAVRGVCCLAVPASTRGTDSAVRTAPRRSARRLIRKEAGGRNELARAS